MGRDCDQPKDWSRVTCRNCGLSKCDPNVDRQTLLTRMVEGHTVKRCREPPKEVSNDYGDGGYGDGGSVQPASDWNSAPVEVSGDWANDGADQAGGASEWQNTEAIGGW